MCGGLSVVLPVRDPPLLRVAKGDGLTPSAE
jgi:hypothetical protein